MCSSSVYSSVRRRSVAVNSGPVCRLTSMAYCDGYPLLFAQINVLH